MALVQTFKQEITPTAPILFMSECGLLLLACGLKFYQSPFCQMIVLEQKTKKHGTARIVIGKYKLGYNLAATPYCHNCVTRWRINKK